MVGPGLACYITVCEGKRLVHFDREAWPKNNIPFTFRLKYSLLLIIAYSRKALNAFHESEQIITSIIYISELVSSLIRFNITFTN